MHTACLRGFQLFLRFAFSYLRLTTIALSSAVAHIYLTTQCCTAQYNAFVPFSATDGPTLDRLLTALTCTQLTALPFCRTLEATEGNAVTAAIGGNTALFFRAAWLISLILPLHDHLVVNPLPTPATCTTTHLQTALGDNPQQHQAIAISRASNHIITSNVLHIINSLQDHVLQEQILKCGSGSQL